MTDRQAGRRDADEEVVADYDVRSPASRTFLTVIGTIAFVAVVAGLVYGASVLARDTRVSSSDIEIGEASQIVVDAGTTDLRIIQGDPDIVRVKARITSGLRKTEFEVGRRGNEIKIVSSCQRWLNPGCGAETTLEIPEGFPVVVRTTSGDVEADTITEGVLTVQSGSGDISGRALKVDEFFASSTSGDIFADFASQPFALKATTTSGDITARIPSGKRTYGVNATSDSGEVTSSITSDADGEGFVFATTTSGDIELSAG